MLLFAAPAQAEQEISGAVITRPEGAYLRYDWWRPVAESGSASVDFGLYDSWLVYSQELGARIGLRAKPEWLEAHLEAAAEPGWFIHLPAGGLAPGAPPPLGRTFDVKGTLRAQVNLNLRGESLWIYSRSTAEGHFRRFPEYDEFREIVLPNPEYDLEQAVAPLYRVAGTPSSGTWLYTEYTVGTVVGVGTLPERVSVGAIQEDWPWKRLTLDLDLYWSFADKPGPGPGLILAWWWRI